jgi:hypothetical protein
MTQAERDTVIARLVSLLMEAGGFVVTEGVDERI